MPFRQRLQTLSNGIGDRLRNLIESEGLLQKGDTAELHCLFVKTIIVRPGHEDDRECEAHRGKMAAQLNARDFTKVDIDNEAGSL